MHIVSFLSSSLEGLGKYFKFKLCIYKVFDTIHIFRDSIETQKSRVPGPTPPELAPTLQDFLVWCTMGHNEQSYPFSTLRDLFHSNCLI